MRRRVWRVEYVAGPENLQRLLNDTADDWTLGQIHPHPTAEPRYTVVLAGTKSEEENET